MSAALCARLTSDAVTFADCLALQLEVTVLCNGCSQWRGIHPENGVPEKLRRRPIMNLMTEDKFKCRTLKCTGRPADAIHVTLRRNHVEDRREILRLDRN